MPNEHIQGHPKEGDMLTCTKTGKAFTVERQGCTSNYATGQRGEYYSDEGVHLCEVEQLLDRTRPMFGYLSKDKQAFTGWKGNVLGKVTVLGTVRVTRLSYTHGKSMLSVRVKDVHGGWWYGRGSWGVCITLRPCKEPK